MKEKDIKYNNNAFVKVRLGIEWKNSHVYVEHNGENIGIRCNNIEIKSSPDGFMIANIEACVDRVDGKVLLDSIKELGLNKGTSITSEHRSQGIVMFNTNNIRHNEMWDGTFYLSDKVAYPLKVLDILEKNGKLKYE